MTTMNDNICTIVNTHSKVLNNFGYCWQLCVILGFTTSSSTMIFSREIGRALDSPLAKTKVNNETTIEKFLPETMSVLKKWKQSVSIPYVTNEQALSSSPSSHCHLHSTYASLRGLLFHQFYFIQNCYFVFTLVKILGNHQPS